MTDGPPFTGQPRSGELTVTSAAAAANIMAGALVLAIEKLAEEHDGHPDEWLDELEEVLLRNAKATVAEGIPIEVESEAIQYGVDMLQAALNLARHRLVRKHESGPRRRDDV
jgi:hypothetical protein